MMFNSVNMFFAVSFLTVAAHAGIERSVDVREFESETIMWVEVESSEQVLVAYYDGSEESAAPFQGISFPDETKERELRLRLKIVKPDTNSNENWRFHWGVESESRFVTSGTSIRFDRNEERVPVKNILLPLNISGMSVYLFPFRSVGNNINFMLVVIGQSKATIRKNIRLIDVEHFDWDTGFRPAVSFLNEE